MKDICADLTAETEALIAVISDIDEDTWNAPTPAEGWSTKDTIVHLTESDIIATLAVADPDDFETHKAAMQSGKAAAMGDALGTAGQVRTGAETLIWFRESRQAMLDALSPLDPKTRIPWFGPSMSALSFTTARLMETWSHGQDIADTVGATIPATDRLRHVAHIGVGTRPWSYMNRGEPVPEGSVRVELTAPSGELWTWNEDVSSDVVRGSAEDFCMVATQRRNLADTDLDVSGPLAEGWMAIAQAFAGPATDTRAPHRS